MTLRITTQAVRGAFLAGLLALGTAAPAAALNPDDNIGTIALVGSSYCPVNTLEAKGQLLQISEYELLFSLFTTTYGGDGQTTFALPDLSGKLPIAPQAGKSGLRYCVVFYGIYPARP
jgi:hypothetical protein